MPLDEQTASIGFSSRDRLSWNRWTCAPTCRTARLCAFSAFARSKHRERLARAAALWRPSPAPGRSGPFTAASGFFRHGQSVPAGQGPHGPRLPWASTLAGLRKQSVACRTYHRLSQTSRAVDRRSPMHARTAHQPPAPEGVQVFLTPELPSAPGLSRRHGNETATV